jgi:hypothetical protein
MLISALLKMQALEERHLSYLQSVTHMDVSDFIATSQNSLSKIKHSIAEYNEFLLSKV